MSGDTQREGADAIRIFHFHTRQRVERPIEDVFAFFADARNLERITPSWLKFVVITEGPLVMAPGLTIDYRLRVRGLPLRWRSEITVWEPPRRFVDVQRRGPYRLWEHEHVFSPADDGAGTIVEDRVRYAVPGGSIVQRLFVARDVERIFAHRERALRGVFPEMKESV